MPNGAPFLRFIEEVLVKKRNFIVLGEAEGVDGFLDIMEGRGEFLGVVGVGAKVEFAALFLGDAEHSHNCVAEFCAEAHIVAVKLDADAELCCFLEETVHFFSWDKLEGVEVVIV